jgi:drug/metabolite transporter (DMT)-like permease
MTLLGCWPFLIAVHASGLETISVPSLAAVPSLLVEIGLSVVTNATYFMTLHYGGPEFTAMANTLIIPLGSVTDYFLHDFEPSRQDVLGGMCIMAAVLIWNGSASPAEKSELLVDYEEMEDAEELDDSEEYE